MIGCCLTLKLLVQAYPLGQFTCEWLKNTNYSDYQPLITTQNEWTIVKYIMEVSRTIWYWTLWMSKMHTVTQHHVVTVYNNMFDHMDGVRQSAAKKMTQWKEYFYFATKFACQKLSKCYTQVSCTSGMHHISAQILDPCWMLQSLRKWDKGMDINPEDKISYTTQYHEVFLKIVENEYCTKHRHWPVTTPESVMHNNHFSPTMASRSDPFSSDPYDLSSSYEEYLMPETVNKMTLRRSDCTPRSLAAARHYLNSQTGLPQRWGLISLNHDNYHSDRVEISQKSWIPDIKGWWRKHMEMHWMYAVLCKAACDTFLIIPHGVTMDASFSLGQNVINWRR